MGWNTAVGLGRYVDVCVLTASRHRAAIERELAVRPNPALTFVYVPVPEALTRVWWLRDVYYYTWQVTALRVARRLHHIRPFDIVHHVSYVRTWSPSPVSRLDAPFVWGPIWRQPRLPWRVLTSFSVRGLVREFAGRLLMWLGEHEPLLRQTVRDTDVALAASPSTVDVLQSLGVADVRLVNMNCPPHDIFATFDNRTYDEETSSVTFISVGRFLDWKGAHLTVRAMACRELEDAELWLVGSGRGRRRLERLARRLGVEDRISFHDVDRATMFELLTRAHVLVNPVLYGNADTVTVEGFASGIPSVTLRVPGGSVRATDATSRIVDLGSTTRETVERLRMAMIELASDPDERRRKGLESRRHVENGLLWSQQAQGYVELYGSLLGWSVLAPENT